MEMHIKYTKCICSMAYCLGLISNQYLSPGSRSEKGEKGSRGQLGYTGFKGDKGINKFNSIRSNNNVDI